MPEFHLSLAVPSIDASVDFFTTILGGIVVHRDASGYVNVDLFGAQLTLHPSDDAVATPPHFHFGFNFTREEFERLAARILAAGSAYVAMEPKTVDEGTPIERRKMYVRCPAGYLIELKGR